MRIRDWSADVCSSDLIVGQLELDGGQSVVEVGLLGDADDRRCHRRVPQHPGQRHLRPRHATGSGDLGDPLDDLGVVVAVQVLAERSEEHTSELQSLMRISYAVFCLKKKTTTNQKHTHPT